MTPEGTSHRQRHGRGLVRVAALACLLALLLSSPPRPGHESRPGVTPERAPSPPMVLILQPDGVNGTDTTILESTPAWTYGGDPSLWTGRDPGNGTMSRSLMTFNLSALPADATILNATMDLYQNAGENGTVTVRLASAPWTEGPSERSWLRIPVTVREPARVRRTNEPVGLTLDVPSGSVVDPASELRMFLGSTEVPSQAYSCAYTAGRVSSCTVYFGASMAPSGTVLFNATTGANSSVVPAYRTGGLGAAALWTAGIGAGVSGASGVSVEDIDGDGGLDVVFGTADGYVRAVTGNGSPLWATRLSTGRSVPYTPQVADVDRDGRMDIVVITNDPSVVRLNSTGGVVWTTTIPSASSPYSTPTLFDVDGNGVLDVLLGNRAAHVDGYNGTTGVLGWSYVVAGWSYTASIFDVDGDGRGEIYFGSDDGFVHAFPATGPEMWSNSPVGTSFIENSVAIGDVDNDGQAEVVTGDDASPGMTFALGASDGRVEWWTPMTGLQEGGQTLADIDGDGRLETILGTSTGAMYALDGLAGAVDWTYSGGTAQASSPAVVDLNDDGNLEAVYLEDGGTTVRVLDRTGALIHSWTIPVNDPALRGAGQKTMATPAVADVNGDGTLEVIVPTGSGVQAFATGALSHDWRTFGYNRNHTHRAGDGNSPDGAPFLEATVGAAVFRPGRGASWDYRDGVTPWMSQGGDFGVNQASVRAGPGWNSWNITPLVTDWYLDLAPNLGVFVWAGPGASSGWHAFHSSDASNASLRPRLTVTYTVPIFDPLPRIVGRVPDLAAAEDSPPFSRDLSMYAADDDSPPAELRWNVTGVDSRVILITGLNVPGNHLLSFYPQKDAWGDRPVTYWLTDLQGHTTRQSAWINITPVNDAPVFTPPATFIIRANATYTFDFGPYIFDVDTSRTGLILQSDDPAHTTVSGFNVSFLYPVSYLDQWVFVGLIVSDGEFSDGKVVALKATLDDPPVLVRLLPDVTIMEGQVRTGVFDLDDYFTDPNHDAMFYSFGYTHLNITIHPNNNSVDIQADSEWTGVEYVTFRGVDTKGAMAEDTILVNVIPVDDPPILGAVPDLRVHYDANFSFNLDPYISDPDTPLDRINASTSSPYVNVSGHLLVLLYPLALNGTVQPLTIFISDGLTTVWRTIQVAVDDDWPPVLQSKLPNKLFLEDTALRDAYNLSAAFTDIDSPTLFWSAGNHSVVVSIDPEGVVELGAKRDWFGVEEVTFRATDSEGGVAEDTVWVTVLAVDDAPYFAPIPTVHMNTTTAYVDLSSYMFDVDTNASDLRLSSPDPHATVYGAGVLLNFTADTTAQVEIELSDGVLSNNTTFIVVVALPVPIPGGGGGEFPTYLYWIPLPVLAVALAAFLTYRWRRVEWALLATNSGLLVSSVFREDPTALDTDLITGMLTAIMNFAKASFSDEKNRELDDLTLGDRRVTVVRGGLGYLAVVYKGRTSGHLPKTMRALLAHIETHYPAALDQVVDSADLEDIPVILKRFVDRAWWPLLSLPEATKKVAAPAAPEPSEADEPESRPK